MILTKEVSVDLFWREDLFRRSYITGMWPVNERRGNKGELSSDQIKTLVPISIKTTQPTLLKVILNTTVFFKKDTTFT